MRARVAASLLSAVLLGGCVDDSRIYRRGWDEAIACVELNRTPHECQDPKRTDAPYLAGWTAAVACMEEHHNLRRCREPEPAPAS